MLNTHFFMAVKFKISMKYVKYIIFALMIDLCCLEVSHVQKLFLYAHW